MEVADPLLAGFLLLKQKNKKLSLGRLKFVVFLNILKLSGKKQFSQNASERILNAFTAPLHQDVIITYRERNVWT